MKANVSPFTVAERKAMEREIMVQTARNIERMSADIQALVLWSLREQYGFGKKRLLEFQKHFKPIIYELQKFYECKNADETDFVCKHRLKHEVGIDVDELDSMFDFHIVVKK